MEVAIAEARTCLSELIVAARRGERVVIIEHGEPAVELVGCARRERRRGIDFAKLEATRRRLGIEGDGERWPEEFNEPAFSRQVLGLDDE